MNAVTVIWDISHISGTNTFLLGDDKNNSVLSSN